MIKSQWKTCFRCGSEVYRRQTGNGDDIYMLLILISHFYTNTPNESIKTSILYSHRHKKTHKIRKHTKAQSCPEKDLFQLLCKTFQRMGRVDFIWDFMGREKCFSLLYFLVWVVPGSIHQPSYSGHESPKHTQKIPELESKSRYRYRYRYRNIYNDTQFYP